MFIYRAALFETDVVAGGRGIRSSGVFLASKRSTPGKKGADAPLGAATRAESQRRSVAHELGVSAQPFMMALTVAGAAAFLTPIATPANLMVMEPAGFRFGDYWRLGLPLAVLFLAVAVLYVPIVWPF